nr:unnamed protein product [Callosobruchus analis]
MREDDIVSVIRYDELLIIFANKMCEKYKEMRHYEMIRHRLRLLGRFFLNLKENNSSIDDFASIYDAKYIDDVLKYINVTSRFNEKTCSYGTPSVAFALSTLIKQCGNILITEYIKKHEDIKKKDVKNFLKIFTQEVNININRTVAEFQLKIKRLKKVELPTMTDIKALRDHLLKLRDMAVDKLKREVTFSNWLSLAEPTLILIQPKKSWRNRTNIYTRFKKLPNNQRNDERRSI